MNRLLRTVILIVMAVLPVSLPLSAAEMSKAEHESHHPGEAGKAGTNAPAAKGGMGGMMGGGMGKMMGGMMEKMGAPKPRDLYPSLMRLPDLPPEQRHEVEREAGLRLHQGVSLLATGVEELNAAAGREDFAAMQKAVAKLHEGVSQMDSGLAAKRALVEGKAPRDVALDWFKKEMNLLPPPTGLSGDHTVLGGARFHLLAIGLLGFFAVGMIAMYFFKMRRASALLATLTAGDAATPSPRDKPAEQRSEPVASPRSPAPASPIPPPEFPDMASPTQPARKWSDRLRVQRIFDETPDVKTFRLVSEDGGQLGFTFFPGQFLTLKVLVNPDNKPVSRSYTIASAPTQPHYCEITVKREAEGCVSRYLHDVIKEGDLLQVSAPNGKFTFSGEEADCIVLIGGGVGITPLMSKVRYLTDIGWGMEIHLLFCCRTPGDFIFREELESLQLRHPNLHVFATMTRSGGAPWMGLRGRFSHEVVNHLVPDITKRRIHVCGPPNLMAGVSEILKQLQVPDAQIHSEAFGPAARPKPKPASSSAEPSAPASASVRFIRSGKTSPMAPGETVLDAADHAGIDIENSCRSGQCGMCKVKLCRGKVAMECEDSLSAEEKAAGQILACQATADENVEVEA